MLSQLPRIVKRSKKRLGRGHGSGKVKTSGRGTKGQKARSTVHAGFEGGQLPIIKRLPFLRGKGRNKKRVPDTYPVPVDELNHLPANSEVTVATLVKYHVIGKDVERAKLLGSGNVSHAHTVRIACSKSARAAIEKAGGTVAP